MPRLVLAPAPLLDSQMLQVLGARVDGPQPAEFNGIKDLEVSWLVQCGSSALL